MAQAAALAAPIRAVTEQTPDTFIVDGKVAGAATEVVARVLARAGMQASDIDLFELNEAFASVVMFYMEQMNISHDRINVNGGAIAIGHPIGASGCRILVTLLHEMQRSGAKKGLAALCIGGGMGVSLTVERS